MSFYCWIQTSYYRVDFSFTIILDQRLNLDRLIVRRLSDWQIDTIKWYENAFS